MSKRQSKETKNESQRIERVAQLAMSLGHGHLADYGAVRSRHDFTQRQLMSCLILRAYLKTTYRGILEVLAVSERLRQCLGMNEKLPHYTTLQKFSARAQVLEIARKLVALIGQKAAQAAPQEAAAMDATGMALTTASDYFQTRKGGKVRKWVKVSVMILCGSLLPLALEVELGAVNDKKHVPSLLSQAQAVAQPSRLYADAGYDSEALHSQCREQWNVESVIKPILRRADGKLGGRWRSLMSEDYLKQCDYGKRWAVETFFSALKRTTAVPSKHGVPLKWLPKPPSAFSLTSSDVSILRPASKVSTEQP